MGERPVVWDRRWEPSNLIPVTYLLSTKGEKEMTTYLVVVAVWSGLRLLDNVLTLIHKA